jgi:predicted adenine nucleotide alpha hydrolase (AANH) superfamily ATPase
MKILVHTCCGPCLIYPAARLKEGGFEIASFAYNPNIHPYSEYLERMQTLARFCAANDIHLTEGDYDFHDYLKRVSLSDEDRCGLCYEMRLDKAAKTAVEMGFSSFTTTLLVSPHQKHALIKEKGEKAGLKHGILFYYDDFRQGYQQAVARSKELDMYRQKYCGCIYSEHERYGSKKIKAV